MGFCSVWGLLVLVINAGASLFAGRVFSKKLFLVDNRGGGGVFRGVFGG